MRLIDHYGADGWGIDEPSALLPRQRLAYQLVADATRCRTAPVRVLDIGCGDGTFLHHLAKHLGDVGVSYVGLDYSEYQLTKARRLPYEFHACDVGEGIPLPNASVDVVHAAEVIEHLYNPDLFIEESARVLRPGGELIITTPNLHAWYNRALFVVGIQPVFHETSTRSTEVGAGALGRLKQDKRPVGHLRLFNRTAILDLLRREGFQPIALLGARFHGVPRRLRWLDAMFCHRPAMASILVVRARKT